jgi:hypothetical protein
MLNRDHSLQHVADFTGKHHEGNDAGMTTDSTFERFNILTWAKP